ncbi:MAG: methionine biosynthesis protein MetW [Proteobacteria bacterium]|nr:methionine biosynthesis protein MetW [Pseudomonadota bacterium]
MRYDLTLIESWIQPGSRVLGLGCGEGDLLYALKTRKAVEERGIEISEKKVRACIEKGLSVIQGDINLELADYPDNSFDYVVLSQTMQQVYAPPELIRSMLRIGKKAVVSFPNFGHWRIRMQLLLSGYVPVTEQLPYHWYNTPNIRVLTIKDFKRFSNDVGFRILKEAAINTQERDMHGTIVTVFPNLRATYGLFLIGKD